MRRKQLIELIIYIFIVVTGIFILLTGKHQPKPVQIPSDYSITQEDKDNAFIPFK